MRTRVHFKSFSREFPQKNTNLELHKDEQMQTYSRRELQIKSPPKSHLHRVVSHHPEILSYYTCCVCVCVCVCVVSSVYTCVVSSVYTCVVSSVYTYLSLSLCVCVCVCCVCDVCVV